jgi:hypothetical protein
MYSMVSTPLVRRNHLSLIPACFSMLFTLPKGMSLFGCGTVARPLFFGCLNCIWLTDLIHFVPTIPRQSPDNCPTVRSRIIYHSARLIIHTLYTLVKDLNTEEARRTGIILSRVTRLAQIAGAKFNASTARKRWHVPESERRTFI